MRAVVFKNVGEVAVEDRPVPTLQLDTDVILKVTVAGLCGSDLHWYRGHQKIPTGFIPGHEFVGTVYQRGAKVTVADVGETVVVRSRWFEWHDLAAKGYLPTSWT